jgi:hypothetical protein
MCDVMKRKTHFSGNQIWRLVCLLVAVIFGIPRSSAQATGTVDFGNKDNGLDAPVIDARTGGRLAGDSWLAQLYYAEGWQGTDTSLLAPAGSPVPFRTGPASGYITPHVVELPGTIPGDAVTLQMRAWNRQAGSTYEDALASPLGVTGMSGFVYVTAGGGELLPPELIGLNRFSVGLSPSTPPFVAVTAPLDGALFPVSGVIVFQAKAGAAPGKAIAQVQFYESTNLLGTDAQPPYQLSLTDLLPARSEPYALSAIAFDDHGFFSTSAPVNVTISQTSPPPVVRFVQPLDGSVIFRYPSEIALTASVQDYTAGQNAVQFYSGNQLLGTVAKPDYIDILTNSADQAKPYQANFYTFILTNLSVGTYDLSASYTDLFPNVGHSQHVSLTVAPPILSDPVHKPRGFVFTVKGFMPGQPFRILTSTNLLDWIPVTGFGSHGDDSSMVIGVETSSPAGFFRYSE